MDHKLIPTIRDATNFDIDKDAAALRKAMKGLGTDEDVIINIITAISNHQRRELIEYYNRTLGRDLMEDLKGDLSGHFRDTIKALMRVPNEYLCKHIKRQLKHRYNLNEFLSEILFPRSNEEITTISACFKQMFPHTTSLAEEVHHKTAEDFRPMFELILQADREPENYVDSAKAHRQADELAACKELHPNTETLYRLLATASFAQLRLVFEKYHEITGISVQDAIKKCSMISSQSCLYNLTICVESPHAFYAVRLRQAMEKEAKDNETIIRIIALRSEIDLGNIKEEYARLYKRTLVNDISDNTSGDYKRTLCAILGA